MKVYQIFTIGYFRRKELESEKEEGIIHAHGNKISKLQKCIK